MAECYLHSAAADAIAPEGCTMTPIIAQINTQFSPGNPPVIPIMNLFMREPHTHGHTPSEQEPTFERCNTCSSDADNTCRTWQCEYLKKHPNLFPPPTSLTAYQDTEVVHPPKQINKLLVTRQDIQREVARRKLLAFYGGMYDLETICRFLKPDKKKRKRRKSKPNTDSEPEEEEEPEPDPEPESEPEPEPETEEVEEKEPEVAKKQKEKKKSDPNRPILKNKEPPADIPRVPRAYHMSQMSPITAVNFLPGKARLVQRYRADDMNRAARKTPIVDEADTRFNLRASSQSPPMTPSL